MINSKIPLCKCNQNYFEFLSPRIWSNGRILRFFIILLMVDGRTMLKTKEEMNWIIPVVGHPSAGKSTLIRYLTGVKVPVGKKPGTTRRIRDFPVASELIIRDYPGFGRMAGRSRKVVDIIQQNIINDLETIKNQILIGIIITDLSNVALMAKKFTAKGYIPLDYEMVEFIAEISANQPMLLGNKIDKLDKHTHPDTFLKYFPANIDYFPVALKHKIGLEPVFYHLQTLVDNKLGDLLHDRWWRP